MTERAREWLAVFESFALEDQRELTREILRRAMGHDDLPDEMLLHAANDLFQMYDDEESPRASNVSSW